MKFEIIGRNYQVAQNLKDVTEKKLAKLDKYFDGKEADIKVACKKQANTLTTEVMLDYCGKFVRATFSSENPYDNLDMVLPKLEGQIRKYRTRFDKNHKNVAFNAVAEFDGDAKCGKGKGSK